MRTLSDSELTAVSGGAASIPDPYPRPRPDGAGMPRPQPFFPDLNFSGAAIDDVRWSLS